MNRLRAKAAGAARRLGIERATRPAPPPFDRRTVLLAGVERDMRVLEIGPSYNPLAPRSEGWETCVVDHATREELIEKYRDPAHGVDVSRIEDVDVVWTEGGLDEAIPRELHGFDVCLASHLIEHTPDLVGFVQGVTAVLCEDGWLSLAVPDMRYCFDLLRAPTRVGQLLDAHARRASRHDLATLYDQRAYATRLDGHIAWEPSADPRLVELLGSLEGARELLSGPPAEYVDCHAWQFTPASFELAVLELSALGLLDVHVAASHDTVGCEFFVTLRRGADVPANAEELDRARLDLLRRSVSEVAETWAAVLG
ncbi:MAG TPA: methyltransferase domain-containing protein [Gaiella sp.]